MLGQVFRSWTSRPCKRICFKNKKLHGQEVHCLMQLLPKSDLEKNSNFMRGFSLDSQTFGPEEMSPILFLSLGNMVIKNYGWV